MWNSYKPTSIKKVYKSKIIQKFFRFLETLDSIWTDWTPHCHYIICISTTDVKKKSQVIFFWYFFIVSYSHQTLKLPPQT